MVKPSRPKLMARVLNAIGNLGNVKGSSVHDVLDFIRQCNKSSRNLTMQVQRALKHAVNAGLLRHKSGRYKLLATLNFNHDSNPSTSKEPAADNQKNIEIKAKSDVQAISDVKPSRTQKRKKRITSRQRNARRRTSKTKRNSRSSPYTERSSATKNQKRRQQKRTHEAEEFENQSSGQYILHGRNDSPVPFDRRTKRSGVSKRKLKSDFSDENDRDSYVGQKRAFRARKSLRRESRCRESPAKSKGRSASRARTPQQQLQQTMHARQHPVEEIENNKEHCNENRGSMERNLAHQEAYDDEERICEPNESNSGSTLESSRD
ncbi:hypothetical protein PUN28_004519 [Cardiocondyla obscurior]|uniref:H15 domain-containing protein n=1 Tax=Cardiocondyla obscurior TaxID=286306 RepID=A0AAW2GF38_9HYME